MSSLEGRGAIGQSVQHPREQQHQRDEQHLGYELYGFQWVVGADNLFDKYPSVLPPAQRYIGAALYDSNTGLGIDGGYYYTRLTYSF